MLDEIKKQLLDSKDEKVRNLAKEIFETKNGKKIIEEFFERKKRRNFRISSNF